MLFMCVHGCCILNLRTPGIEPLAMIHTFSTIHRKYVAIQLLNMTNAFIPKCLNVVYGLFNFSNGFNHSDQIRNPVEKIRLQLGLTN